MTNNGQPDSSTPPMAEADSSDIEESVSPQMAAALEQQTSTGDARFMLVAGSIFLAIMTSRYLYMVLRQPEPLPWKRGQQFQLFEVDVNSATWIEWSQLEGIGPSLAHRIVADRKVNGLFQSIDDLLRVEGIGPATLDRIRPWLTISHENIRTDLSRSDIRPESGSSISNSAQK